MNTKFNTIAENYINGNLKDFRNALKKLSKNHNLTNKQNESNKYNSGYNSSNIRDYFSISINLWRP